MVNNDDGITFNSIKHLTYARQYWNISNAGTYLSIRQSVGFTTHIVNISGCRFEVSVGDTGVYVNGNEVNYELIGFNTNDFTDGGVYLDGFSLQDNPEIEFFANFGVTNYTYLPHFTTSEIAEIPNPDTAMLVFNETDDKIAVFNGAIWVYADGTEMWSNLFVEDWSSGTYATNSWVTASGTSNFWIVGTSEPYGSSSYASYITYNGTTPLYNVDILQISHIYIDIPIPSTVSEWNFDVAWKCNGEVNYDYGLIFVMPTSVTPSAGYLPNNAYLKHKDLNNTSNYTVTGTDMGTQYVGSTARLVLTWYNDNSVGTQPPFIVGKVTVNVKH